MTSHALTPRHGTRSRPQSPHVEPGGVGRAARFGSHAIFVRLQQPYHESVHSITAAVPRVSAIAGGRRNPGSRAVFGADFGSAARRIAYSWRPRFNSPAFAFATVP
jgi:hypothetical protein